MKREKTKHPNIFRDPRSGIYYYRKGKIEKSLKTDDFKIALQKVKILESTIDQLSPNAFKHRVGDLYPMYQENRQDQVKKEDLAKNSFEEMTALFRKHLLPHFEKMRLAEINERTWAKYCAMGLVNDYANHRKCMNGFLKWAKAEGYLAALPDITTIPKHRRRPRRNLRPDELKTIFRFARGNLLLFLSIAFLLGMRRKEIMTLEWDWINIGERKLTIQKKNNKKRRSRELPLRPELLTAFTAKLNYLATKKIRTKFVFPNASNPKRHASLSAFKTAWKTVKTRIMEDSEKNHYAWDNDITWHDFRATFDKYIDKSSGFSDMQKDKFADATKQTRERIYVNMTADDLRGLEDVVFLDGLDAEITNKLVITGK